MRPIPILLLVLSWLVIGCGGTAARAPLAPGGATAAAGMPATGTPAPAPRVCGSCGAAIPDDAKYCLGCGARQKPPK